MTNQLREVVHAIYELTVNPGITPSNWENLAEEIQLAITTKDSNYLHGILNSSLNYCVAVHDPDAEVTSRLAKIQSLKKVTFQRAM